ncbi:MAG: hypothetical protein LLG02_14830 [Pelosinus sp.]|nr:hypothetical protein [Pelosinus sp.]
MDFLIVLLVAALFLVVAIWLYIAHQGDAEIAFLVNERTPFTLVEKTQDTAVFSAQVPFINKGTQDGIIMDAYTRHLLPREQYDGVAVVSRLELDNAPRDDGYFEAYIVPIGTGRAVIVTVKLTAQNGDITAALKEMPDMGIDIVYQVLGRTPWYITKAPRIVMKQAEILTAVGDLG